MKIFVSVISSFVILLISSCYYDKEEVLYPITEERCDTATVTYSDQISRILNADCLVCHGNDSYSTAGAGINLDSYGNLKSFVDNGRFLGSIKHEQGFSPMPKNGTKLSDCDILIIETWINSGSPNN